MDTHDTGVLVLHNVPLPGSGESDAGVLEEARAVTSALVGAGIPCETVGIEDLRDLPAILSRKAWRIAFNLVEATRSSPADAMLVPSICRAFGIESTGGDTACLTLTLDKGKTRQILAASGLTVPRGIVVPPGSGFSVESLPQGPCIVKPVALDASEGIDSHSVADRDSASLRAAIGELHRKHNQPALIEQFIGRREINVSLIELDGKVTVLPLAEIDFSPMPAELPPIVGYRAKWVPNSPEYNSTPRVIPARIDDSLAQEIRRMALAAWNATGCRDYARVDFRLDDNATPVILEVNPNPDISPDAGFAAACLAGGIDFRTAVTAIARNAFARAGIDARPHAPHSPSSRQHSSLRAAIRPALAADRTYIRDMADDRKFFRPGETAVAMEVFDTALLPGNPQQYYSFVAELDGRPVGWICHGPIPCTVDSHDIYWVIVDPKCRRYGIGSALMQFAENDIRQRGGRLAVIETSGREVYATTTAFYRRNGYLESARVRDFYAPGDDQIILAKNLSGR